MAFEELDSLLAKIDSVLQEHRNVSQPFLQSFRQRVAEWRASLTVASRPGDAEGDAFTEVMLAPTLRKLTEDIVQYQGATGSLTGFFNRPEMAAAASILDAALPNLARRQMTAAKVLAKARAAIEKSALEEVAAASSAIKDAIAHSDALTEASAKITERLEEIDRIEARVRAGESALTAAVASADALRVQLAEVHGTMIAHRESGATNIEALEKQHARFASAITAFQESAENALSIMADRREAEAAQMTKARETFEGAAKTTLDTWHTEYNAFDESSKAKLSSFVEASNAELQNLTQQTDETRTRVEARSQAVFEKLDAALRDAGERLDGKEKSLDATVEQWTTAGGAELAKALDQLGKARAELNRQGLAGAYHARVAGMRVLIRNYNRAFAGIIGGFIAFFAWRLYVLSATPPTDTTIWIQLAVSGPVTLALVWAGWICVSRVNVFTRVIEDYEFKAATATAFEAYKREVQDADDKLKRELIRRAINNFGLSPTRLMPASKSQHATPTAAALKPFGELIGKVADLLKAGKPTP